MPQMAPLMWLTLFFMFIFIFLMFNILNYFNFYSSNTMSKNTINNKSLFSNFLIWKW